MPKTKTSFTDGHKKIPGSGAKKGIPTGRTLLGAVANEAFDYAPDESFRKPTRMEHGFRVILSKPEQYPKEFLTLAKYLYPEFQDTSYTPPPISGLGIMFDPSTITDKETRERLKALCRHVGSIDQPGDAGNGD